MTRFLLMILLWMIPLSYAQQKKYLRSLQEEPAMNPRIIGGKDASRDRFPAMVVLADRYMETKCGGTLISPTVVLTAAHCRPGLLHYAVIGRYDITDSREQYEAIPIKQQLVHPQNDGPTFNYDMMLLILERAPTRAVEYMRISKTPPKLTAGQDLVSLGWGVTSPDDEDVNQVLQQVTLQYVTNDQCEQAISKGKSYEDEITEDMLCTFAPEKDHCYGDSGGPVLSLGATPAEDVQVGIVSWGYECASPVFPGVAARTSYGYDWIRQQICIFDGDSSDYECDPALTEEESSAPSRSLSEEPSSAPSRSLSEEPSNAPSRSLSEEPSSTPSRSLSEKPSSTPSRSLSEEPSSAPSTKLENPLWSLTAEPMSAPSKEPTLECGSVQALCTRIADCCSERCVMGKCQKKIPTTRQKLGVTGRGGAAGRREIP